MTNAPGTLGRTARHCGWFGVMLWLCCPVVAVIAAEPAPAPTALTVTARAEGPHIVLAEEIWDFGNTLAGHILPHAFRLTNTGTRPLEILEVKPACGCTQAAPYHRIVPPGAAEELAFRLHTENMRGFIRRSIQVRSNAVDRPLLTLWVQGNVSADIEVDPGTLDFGVLDPEQAPFVRRVHIVNHRPEAVRLRAPVEVTGIYHCSWKEIRPGREFELTVEAISTDAYGVLPDTLEIWPEEPKIHAIRIPVTAFVPAAVDVRPQTLVLDAQPLVAPLERVVSIRYTRPGKLTLSEVALDAGGASAQLLDPPVGKRFRIAVRFPAGYRLPRTGAELSFRTGDPDTPEVKVPVRLAPAGEQR